ncbi:MAG: efflux RND transporter permease subunit, partial [Chlamydiia bacterium]|nr:efflux RND transporter permease subunit [Chlamydiia bacterium]
MNGAIAWMARNRVTSNLIMIFLMVGGFFIVSRLKQEVFPAFELDIIRVSVLYPGASPEEVEKGIILAVEDEVRGLDGIKKVTSKATEGSGTVLVELLTTANKTKALQDVKNAVDSIQSLPEEAERPIITLIEARRQVISLVIYGDQPRSILRNIAEKVRDDLVALEDVTLVELAAQPEIEITVEVPRSALRAYGLTLEQIANKINTTALELPGGGVKSAGGEILLRTLERRDFASEFFDIPIVTGPDGAQVRLSDIATIKEQFEETDKETFFNGLPAVRIDVFSIGEQKPLELSAAVRTYAEKLQKQLPAGVSLAAWDDRSELYRDRIDLLMRNAAMGLILVMLLLGLFLEPRLAFWVTLGIPISILGAFLLIFFTTVSINMVSLFAFILTLGIIVDDAIIVGENVYKKREEGMPFLKAAIEGTQEIAVPVVFAVLTNIAAFTPLFLIPGTIGKIFLQIPTIVCAVLVVSLFESLFILPSHLAREHGKSRFWTLLTRPSIVADRLLDRFIENVYQKHVKVALNYRYITLGFGVALLIISYGLIQGGILQFSFLPRVDNDIITVQAELPVGVPIEQSRALEERLVKAAQKVIARNGGDISRGIYTQIGTKLGQRGPQTSAEGDQGGSHLVAAQVLLVSSDLRAISGLEFSKQWEKEIGEIPGIDSLIFIAEIGTGTGEPINIELTHPDRATSERAGKELAAILATYQGVTQIDSGVTSGKPQINFKIKPEAQGLGLSVRDLAAQVRSSFYGAEALRQQRGRNEMKVMVRLPKEERSSAFTVEDLMLRTPSGAEFPLKEATNIDYGRSYTEINRTDGRRTIAVTADVDEAVTNANVVIADVVDNVLPKLMEKYPDLTYSLEGEQREQLESLDALALGFVFALLMIYTLLAIPFKSYAQPAIVMVSIPFGVIGAFLGHLLLGYE